MDPLDRSLRAWLLEGGPPDAPLEALCREWRPILHGLLTADQVEDALQDAILELVLAGAHRVLAPADAQNARAWRRRVLKNHVIDRRRKLSRRLHAELAARKALDAAEEREAWRRRKAGGEGVEALAERPAVQVDETPILRIQTQQERAQVEQALPKLPPSSALLLALLLDLPGEPFVEPLARQQKEEPDALRARVREAEQALQDQGKEPLPLALARVFGPKATTIDTLQRYARRAVARLRELLGRDP